MTARCLRSSASGTDRATFRSPNADISTSCVALFPLDLDSSQRFHATGTFNLSSRTRHSVTIRSLDKELAVPTSDSDSENSVESYRDRVGQVGNAPQSSEHPRHESAAIDCVVSDS